MSRVLYFDCFSGISGDMVLGACLDAGLPFDELRQALGTLAVSGYDVRASRVLRCGVAATKFDVIDGGESSASTVGATLGAAALGSHEDHLSDVADHAAHHHPGSAVHHHAHEHRTLAQINQLIEQSGLSPAGRERAKALFFRLAETEAAIHQVPIDRIHLHEVGALDSIIDIVGSVFALEWIHADRVVCSPLNVGGGMVRSAHGVFPVPAPATLRLLGRAPIYGGDVQNELVTPTGALLATSYASSFGPVPAMTVERVGYGAGARNNPETPNVLRLLVGEMTDPRSSERVLVLECEIDDMNPQIFGIVMERLYQAGALDVYYVPVQMKKNRPGTLLTVVASPERTEALSAIIFAETTTIGLRRHEVERERLARETITVATPLGPVRFKLARRDGRVVNAAPEFDDCARLAVKRGRTVKDVQALAVQCYGTRGQTPELDS
jgi:uncharacterized protein (TIGR00299 family) protein